MSAPAPDPYAYPPYEIILRDLAEYTPIVQVDSETVQYYMGLANDLPQIVNDEAGMGVDDDALWFPKLSVRGSDRCNLTTLTSERTSDFLYGAVPPGRLTKITITVSLSEALAPGDFDPKTSFFTTLPTPYVVGTSNVKRPFWIGYVRGSTDTYAFRRNDANNNGSHNGYREPIIFPRNVPFLWYSFDELVSQMDLRVESVFSERDTYVFTADVSQRGIILESGDKLKYYCGQGGYILKVRGIYLRYEFEKQKSPGANAPYTMAGVK